MDEFQTHPLILTTPLTSHSTNPFLKPSTSSSVIERRLEDPSELNLREAAARKTRVLPPSAPVSLASTSNVASTSPITPKANSSNPFRMQPTPESPPQELRASRQASTQPPRPPESTTTAKSPPLPPRRQTSLPKQPPPKHISQLHTKLDDGTQTPSTMKPLHVPAIGPTSLDIISSSLQPEHTGHSNASSSGRQAAGSSSKVTQQATGNKKAVENGIRLLGSSHIGVDAKPLRAKPPAAARHSSSSEELTLHKNASDSSLSSLAGMLPRGRRDTYSSTTASTVNADSQDLRNYPHHEEEEEAILSSEFTAPDASVNLRGQTTLKGLVVKSKPPLPPPPRRRPESMQLGTTSASRAQQLVFGSTPMAGHPVPYTATSIRSSPVKHRTNSVPYVSHGRAASVAGSSYSQPSYGRPLTNTNHGLMRATSVAHRHTPLENLLSKGRDVSHEWLEKARSTSFGAAREDRQGLISADEVAYTAKVLDDNSNQSDDSDRDSVEGSTARDRRRERERIRTEEEPGWARLE